MLDSGGGSVLATRPVPAQIGPVRERLPAAGLPVGGDGTLGSVVAEALVGAAEPTAREITMTSLNGQFELSPPSKRLLRPANAWPTGGPTRPCRTRPVTG